MAKKKKKKNSGLSGWAQRVGKRMDRRQKARQAVKLAEAGVDPTSIGGFGAKGSRRGKRPTTVGQPPAADWQEYILPAAVVGGLVLVLSRSDKGK